MTCSPRSMVSSRARSDVGARYSTSRALTDVLIRGWGGLSMEKSQAMRDLIKPLREGSWDRTLWMPPAQACVCCSPRASCSLVPPAGGLDGCRSPLLPTHPTPPGRIDAPDGDSG